MGCSSYQLSSGSRIFSPHYWSCQLSESGVLYLEGVSCGVLFKLCVVLQVPVAFWSVEATQPAWAEARGELDDPDDSLEDLMEVEVVSNNNNKMAACCQPPCCGLSCVG